MQQKFTEISYARGGKFGTQKITLSAMLAALSLIFVLVVPTLDLGVWSFTPFSHMFLFLAIFISPYTGAMTYVTVFFGFVMKGASPLILLRAGSHIFFTLTLILVISLRPVKSTKQLILWAIVAALIHAAAEILSVVIGIAMGISITNSVSAFYYIAGVVGGGTIAHSLIDTFAAYGIYIVLKRAFPWLNTRASAAPEVQAEPENKKIEFRPLSLDDGQDIYEMLQEIPAEENGFTNGAHGLTFEEFKEWLVRRDNMSKGIGLEEWQVPQTNFWLFVEGVPVGLGKLRSRLTVKLRGEGGHAGYGVRPSERNKGYGKLIVKYLTEEAKKQGIDRMLVTVKNYNIASIKAATSYGGKIEKTDENRHYIWTDLK